MKNRLRSKGLIKLGLFFIFSFFFLSSNYAQSLSNSYTYKNGLDVFLSNDKLIDSLKAFRFGVVVNQTSLTEEGVHLVDAFKATGLTITRIFAPEHGFRGRADAGEFVPNGIDSATNIVVRSLYGAKKKPHFKDLDSVDILLYDIQDVGCRFYTYISTLQFVMEAAAENKIKFLLLDRPGFHDNRVEGPILNRKFESFVGMQAIPVLYGLTPLEYAQFLVGERLLRLQNDVWAATAAFYYIRAEHYKRGSARFVAPPSPNLLDTIAINRYPSLCLFEATPLSVGRGTAFPFKVIGGDNVAYGNFSFTPSSTAGAKNPPLKGALCFGENYTDSSHIQGFSIHLLKRFYDRAPNKELFFTSFLNKLSGDESLLLYLKEGRSLKRLQRKWRKQLKPYLRIRKKYLVYE